MSKNGFTIRGAGVAGLCLATELKARDAEVTLLDPQGLPDEHGCSWWAGGMLAPDCEGETAEDCIVRAGRKAIGWWEKSTGAVHHKGTLVLALDRDQSELRRFARRTENHRAVSGDEIDSLEPDLAGRFSGGLFFEQESHLDPRKALLHLSNRLQEQGVSIQSPSDVRESGAVIDCRGLHARDVITDLRGVKGEMLVIRCPDIRLNRPVRLLHPRVPLYIVPREGEDGTYMLGATMIESSDRQRITARSMLEMLSAAYALHPAFGEAEILEIGVDVRPAFADNRPRVILRGQDLFINGLYRHGYLMAPVLAELAADWLLKGHEPEDSSFFRKEKT
ncbi:FAD-dependent oxidoreductase [Kiloniella sp. b19]|uniref:FAD-dependent oxidoreductase n=1 Tax=Kiloniella sp. GXU_MW_B19 TaxID=3141326 RepID=UPI0031E3C393